MERAGGQILIVEVGGITGVCFNTATAAMESRSASALGSRRQMRTSSHRENRKSTNNLESRSVHLASGTPDGNKAVPLNRSASWPSPLPPIFNVAANFGRQGDISNPFPTIGNDFTAANLPASGASHDSFAPSLAAHCTKTKPGLPTIPDNITVAGLYPSPHALPAGRWPLPDPAALPRCTPSHCPNPRRILGRRINTHSDIFFFSSTHKAACESLARIVISLSIGASQRARA